MNDAELMTKIEAQYRGVINQAVARSSLPAAFLAALIANESGGDPHATRLEPSYVHRLHVRYPDWNDAKVERNATSWGLTQIMGINYAGDPRDLADPQTNLIQAVRMLSNFAERFQLDLTKEFDELFHCWNTGQPDRPTYDPLYAAKGIARMALWQSAAQAA